MCICVYVLLYDGIFAPCNSDFGIRVIWNPLTNEIKNPSSADKDVEYLEFGIQGVESRFEDCPGFPFFRARDMVPKSPLGITLPFSLVFENTEKLSLKFTCWGFCLLEVYCP